ncbi:hypothetical protein D0867_12357 [Hortaea werneckii]|uniref:Uncharacterized protein n=1 Tax=Hortaea werneckii TaxID=91943 RepID=A0A3M6Y6Z2_HORWE|nr:hypothetical protein D0867_12357 [Hortaea werneckii]RMY19581.1 hypothetical protein D0866_12779 [Hortaea werneckii]
MSCHDNSFNVGRSASRSIKNGRFPASQADPDDMRRLPFPWMTLCLTSGPIHRRIIKESDVLGIRLLFSKLAIQFGHLPHVLLSSEMPAPHLGHDE